MIRSILRKEFCLAFPKSSSTLNSTLFSVKNPFKSLNSNDSSFRFSTYLLKNYQNQQGQLMDKFPKTLALLNSMITRLEANTGGEVNPSHTKAEQSMPVQINQSQQQKRQQPKKEYKKNTENKPKEADNKQPKTKKQTDKKEPQSEGPKQVDPKFFAQVDIRIGEIFECWKHPNSQNLYCEKINIGKEVREIASGLQKFVTHDKMKGKVLVMANLKPRPLAGFNSNGMVVCASNTEHTNVELLIPDGEIGDRVYLQGHEELFQAGEILPVLNPKRKVVQKCLEHFRTDQEGFVVWQGIRLRTKNGFMRATIINGNVG